MWSWIQDDSTYNAATDTTAVQILTSSVTSGSLLIVSFSCANTGTPTATCADTLNGAYTLCVGPTRNESLGFVAWTFYYPNSAAGANTVTVTISQTETGRRINVLEYGGLTASPLDVTASATGPTGNPDSGSNSTTASDELIFGYVLSGSNDLAAGSGFTFRTQANGNDHCEDKNGGSPGSYNTTWTHSSNEWIAQMATFKTAGGDIVRAISTMRVPSLIM